VRSQRQGHLCIKMLLRDTQMSEESNVKISFSELEHIASSVQNRQIRCRKPPVADSSRPVGLLPHPLL